MKNQAAVWIRRTFAPAMVRASAQVRQCQFAERGNGMARAIHSILRTPREP